MTHEQLVESLRVIAGLVDVGGDPPNFHFRSQPFLHFHRNEDGTYADVRIGGRDFEPLWASNPREREELLACVIDHVERAGAARKRDGRRRGRPARNRRAD